MDPDKTLADVQAHLDPWRSQTPQVFYRYEFARSLVDRIFGPKFHKDFPREKRVSGGGCSGEGFYPSSLGNENDEYQYDGIDLLNKTGEKLVAPFSGTVIRTENENEIVLFESGELPPESELVITNIDPDEDIVHLDDPAYDEKNVHFLMCLTS